MLIIFNKWIGWGMSCWSKIPRGSPTISEIEANLHQDFPASTHNNFMDRWTGAYSIGLTIPEKLSCPNNNNKIIETIWNRIRIGYLTVIYHTVCMPMHLLPSLLHKRLWPGNTKREVSLYCWPPVWLVWISLFFK